jgi:hypothetical protein
MPESSRFTEALNSLEAALTQLEGVVAERLEREASFADLEEELDIMQDDRNRLALELDSALARAAAVEKARDEALRRVDRASDEISAVLGDAPPRRE